MALADKVKHSDIRSPVRGTVKRLLVNTVGGVVQPGKDVVEVVPLDDALLLEAKVLPKDIAFLRPGQKAIVKFTAYDFSIYGGLDATLEHIGADTVTDENGNAFYMVRVRTGEVKFRRQAADHSRHGGRGGHPDRAEKHPCLPAETGAEGETGGVHRTLTLR